MFLTKGMDVSVVLSWHSQATDFDLFFIPENKVLSSGNSIMKGAASGTNPETGRVIIPHTGNYIFVVNYFSGDGTDQEFTLDVIARNIVYQNEETLENSIEISLFDLDIVEADYLIESTSHGWNTNFKFTQLFRFDAFAPQLHLLESKLSGAKKWLNINETAHYLGYSKDYIHKLKDSNFILNKHYYKKSGKLLFDKDELDLWVTTSHNVINPKEIANEILKDLI